MLQSFLHGDLRSPNIFVVEDDRVKIGDFGLAKLLADGSANENANPAHANTSNNASESSSNNVSNVGEGSGEHQQGGGAAAAAVAAADDASAPLQSSAATSQTADPRWLAPEALTRGRIMRSSDVFSFGVVMWEMLTWQEPFANIPVAQVRCRPGGANKLTLPNNTTRMMDKGDVTCDDADLPI